MRTANGLLTKISLVALTSGIVGIATLGVAHSTTDTEIARVNGKVITLQDLNQRFQQSLQFYQPETPTKKGLLDSLINRELVIEQAKKAHLDKDPAVIDAMNNVLFNAMINKQLGKDFQELTVTDEEAKEFYEKNPEIRTSEIFVPAPAAAPAELRKKARARMQEIYADHIRPGKEDFAAVAQHFSEGPAATMGGDIDYKMRDMLDPAYYHAALALRSPGRVSGIVQSQAGYHIIKLTGVRSWDDVDRAAVKRMLIQERQRQEFQKYVQHLRSEASVKIHSELLKD